MKFDFTINVGEVLTAAGLLLGFYAAHSQGIRKMQELETKLDLMYAWFQEVVIRRNGGNGGGD